jgi:hypothetical protein
MKNKSIRKKKTKVVSKRTQRRRVPRTKAKTTTDNMKSARATRGQEVFGANPDAVQEGIIEVIEVWGVESTSTEDEVNNAADTGPANSEESGEE